MEILTIIIGAICLIIFLKILIKLTKERFESMEAKECMRANSEHYKKMELMETEIMNYKREIELKEEMINLIKKKGEKHGRLHRSNRASGGDNKTCNSNRVDIIVK